MQHSAPAVEKIWNKSSEIFKRDAQEFLRIPLFYLLQDCHFYIPRRVAMIMRTFPPSEGDLSQ